MPDQLPLCLDATPPGVYRQRGVSSLQRLFRAHFPDLTARFEQFSARLGRFRLCPSCSQKRTLLFGEYMSERLMLLLPHRQVVFTFPKVLRFHTEAAGRAIQGAAVISYASAGDFVRWNPHLHAVFLEGGFDGDGRFLHVPSLDFAKLSQWIRCTASAAAQR